MARRVGLAVVLLALAAVGVALGARTGRAVLPAQQATVGRAAAVYTVPGTPGTYTYSRPALTATVVLPAQAYTTTVAAAPTTAPATTTQPTTTTAPAGGGVQGNGVYVGTDTGCDRLCVAQWFDQHYSAHLQYLEDFLPVAPQPSQLASPQLGQYQGMPYRLILGTPMFPAGGSLARCAAGAYDSTYSQLGSSLAAAGQAAAVVRLGWEFNGDWYPWRASADPTGFVGCWQHLYTAIKAADPQAVIVWGGTVYNHSAAAYYPGDSYVDWIGTDAYDQVYGCSGARWQCLYSAAGGLGWWVSFAAQHGKPFVVPEWGATIRDDGSGGGDDPAYITHMAALLQQQASPMNSYFDYDASDGEHILEAHFPQAAQAYTAAFGS